jgi:SAM-dependent methyltransferase
VSALSRGNAPVSAPPFTCRLCQGPCDGPFAAREMILGRRELFDYHACRECGALEIAAYPPNLGDYYPDAYYSLGQKSTPGRFPRLAGWLKRHRAARELGALDPIGELLVRWRGRRDWYRWLRVAGVGFDSAILDVGCGDGRLLAGLHADGFTNLEGVDPFTHDADRRQDGFVIRRDLAEARGPYDFVLMDDSLEHMPDQAGVLAAVKRVCGPRTTVCLSLPVVGEAWRRYGVDWVQLDPPRHLYLHTERSLGRLAAQAGFTIQHVSYDSTGFQFWGSEQYRLDVPLNDRRSPAQDPHSTMFSAAQMQRWEEQARALNAARTGDHATFFLRLA